MGVKDEQWKNKWREILKFIEDNHRRPSKYKDEERAMVNWMKYNRKIRNAGKLTGEHLALFNQLLDKAASVQRVNQYMYLSELRKGTKPGRRSK